MIRFNCLSCGMAVSAPEDCTGRSTKCRRCNALIVVPYTATIRTSPEPIIPTRPILETPSWENMHKPRIGVEKAAPILALALVLAVFGSAGLLMWKFYSPSSLTPERDKQSDKAALFSPKQEKIARNAPPEPRKGLHRDRGARTQVPNHSEQTKNFPPILNPVAPENRFQPAPENEPSSTEMTEQSVPPEKNEHLKRRDIEEGKDSPTAPSQQDKSTSGEPPADKPTPIPGTLLKEVVTGYETRKLLGFTFLLSTQVIKESQKENGKPFKALQAEFDGLVHVLPANALKHLRGILIWVEWDNIDRRDPRVLAKYYGGRIWRLDGSAHPLKSKAVEVLSLKRLAKEKANAREKSRLVLLHELAHVVHHLALGFNNIDVVYAYNQAMDRRLYDKVEDVFGREVRAYAATNNAEYFAELSCAYLDRCFYFPFTRADLREHDPTGYRLMQKVWGTGKKLSGRKKQSK